MVCGVGGAVSERRSLLLAENKKQGKFYEDCHWFLMPATAVNYRKYFILPVELRKPTTEERMNAIKVLLEEEEQMTLITTFDGLMNRLIRPEKLERFILQLSLGGGTDLNGFYQTE